MTVYIAAGHVGIVLLHSLSGEKELINLPCFHLYTSFGNSCVRLCSRYMCLLVVSGSTVIFNWFIREQFE